MTKSLIILTFFPLALISCGGEKEAKDPNKVIVDTPYLFPDYQHRISYCIGLDHGFTVAQVYEGERTTGKFNLADIEAGLVDYLGDGELRISIFSIDSILELYLGENGEVNESLVSKSDASYAIGLVEGQTLVGSMVGRGIDQQMIIEQLVAGVSDGMNSLQPRITLGEARTEVSAYYMEMNQIMGESFLAKNAQNESVISTESGLQYEVFREGTGIRPNLTDSVTVHYTGRFIDGRVFESTIPSQHPATFTPLGVIPGWQEGLLLMREGGSARFFIPHQLAYGPTGSGPIEPFSALVFDIDLLKVKRFNP